MDYERKNKWNEWVKVPDWCCGSCDNYAFEDERYDNKCRLDGRYYSLNDCYKCSSYRVAKDIYKSSGTGCFLTTAACDYMDLPDDCYELQTMREFRDNILLRCEYGCEIVKKYYAIAPAIVERIHKHPNREEILKHIFAEIMEIVGYIDDNRQIEAVARYIELTHDAEEMSKLPA